MSQKLSIVPTVCPRVRRNTNQQSNHVNHQPSQNGHELLIDDSIEQSNVDDQSDQARNQIEAPLDDWSVFSIDL